MKITDIQVFDYCRKAQGPDDTIEIVEAYSANVVINDSFLIQWDSKWGWSIPTPDEICWNCTESQGDAYDRYDVHDLAKMLDAKARIACLIEKKCFEN